MCTLLLGISDQWLSSRLHNFTHSTSSNWLHDEHRHTLRDGLQDDYIHSLLGKVGRSVEQLIKHSFLYSRRAQPSWFMVLASVDR